VGKLRLREKALRLEEEREIKEFMLMDISHLDEENIFSNAKKQSLKVAVAHAFSVSTTRSYVLFY
jgi:hypothetical protein